MMKKNMITPPLIMLHSKDVSRSKMISKQNISVIVKRLTSRCTQKSDSYTEETRVRMSS